MFLFRGRTPLRTVYGDTIQLRGHFAILTCEDTGGKYRIDIEQLEVLPHSGGEWIGIKEVLK